MYKMNLLKPLESVPLFGGGVKWFDTQMHNSLFQHSVFGAIVFLVVSNTDVYKLVKDIIFDVTGYKADGNTMHLIHAVVFAIIMYFGSLFILAPLLTEGGPNNPSSTGPQITDDTPTAPTYDPTNARATFTEDSIYNLDFSADTTFGETIRCGNGRRQYPIHTKIYLTPVPRNIKRPNGRRIGEWRQLVGGDHPYSPNPTKGELLDIASLGAYSNIPGAPKHCSPASGNLRVNIHTTQDITPQAGGGGTISIPNTGAIQKISGDDSETINVDIDNRVHTEEGIHVLFKVQPLVNGRETQTPNGYTWLNDPDRNNQWTNRKILTHFDRMFANGDKYTTTVRDMPSVRLFLDMISFNFDPGLERPGDSNDEQLDAINDKVGLYRKIITKHHQDIRVDNTANTEDGSGANFEQYH